MWRILRCVYLICILLERPEMSRVSCMTFEVDIYGSLIKIMLRNIVP